MNNFDWKPDKNSLIPLYIQIMDFMRSKIANGEWAVGSKIPPQREFAKLLKVNRSTIVTAYEELEAEGLIKGTIGHGTIVTNNTWSLFTSSMPPDWNSYIKSGIYYPNLNTIQRINRLEFQPGIIRLGTGELSPELYPRDTSKIVLKRIAEKIDSLGYEEPKGMLALRRNISNYLRNFGIDASPSSILIVSGALQGLQLISIGLLNRGATIFTENPSYINSIHLFQSMDMSLYGIPMDEKGIMTSYISQFKKQKNASLIYTIPTFHNPTGISMDLERRKELLAVCEKERLPIIEDDVYRDLWIDEEPSRPIKTLDKNGLVLYMGSISKTLSPGLRIGWIVGPEPVVERLADIKMQIDYGSSSLSQHALSEWLSSGLYYEHIKRVRKELYIRREVARETMEEYFKDLGEWNIPRGGFYIWFRLKNKVHPQELFDRALKSGILLNPGSMYDAYSKQSIRISYSYAKGYEIKQGLKEFSKIIRSLM